MGYRFLRRCPSGALPSSWATAALRLDPGFKGSGGMPGNVLWHEVAGDWLRNRLNQAAPARSFHAAATWRGSLACGRDWEGCFGQELAVEEGTPPGAANAGGRTWGRRLAGGRRGCHACGRSRRRKLAITVAIGRWANVSNKKQPDGTNPCRFDARELANQ